MEITKNFRQAIVSVLMLSVLGIGSYEGYQRYQVRQEELRLQALEEARVAHLDTENLDLPFILNKVDELGGSKVQLNWKELVAIAAVQSNNYVDQISDDVLQQLAGQFIVDASDVRSFEDVLTQQLKEVPQDPETIEGLSRKEVKSLTKAREEIMTQNKEIETRAHQYLEDLTYIGYTPEKLLPEAKESQFIESLTPGAIENYQNFGILPSITIAQAILESNWGTSELAEKGKNFFGVKVGYNWEGDVIQMETREYHDTWITDDFRKYEDVAQSLHDHGQFLVENPRYEKAGVFKQKTYRDQAKALQDAGYSTDQDEEGNYVYADKLGALIRQYNLQLIDHEVLHPE